MKDGISLEAMQEINQSRRPPPCPFFFWINIFISFRGLEDGFMPPKI